MSERIKELARQAELAELYDRYVEYCMKNADDDIMDYDTIVKKFAELIVKECIMLLYEDDGATHHEQLIKQHFGVEE